jgi:hypothetical protein
MIKGFFLVMRAEFVRAITISRRYWFATLLSLTMGYSFIMGLIYALASGQAEDKFAYMATGGSLGLIIGAFAFAIIGIFTQGLQGMARSGELEQVCMSPHGLIGNFLARSLVSSITSIFSLSIIFALIAKSVGSKLHFDPIATVAVLFLTYVNLIGFGFMIGGLVLVFKQIGPVTTVFRLAQFLLTMMAATTELMNSKNPFMVFIHLIPALDATVCLKAVLLEGIGLAVFGLPSMYWLIGNGIVWTIIGMILFHYMENISRDKGTLGAF